VANDRDMIAELFYVLDFYCPNIIYKSLVTEKTMIMHSNKCASTHSITRDLVLIFGMQRVVIL